MAQTNRITEDSKTRLTEDGATRILETGSEPAEPPQPAWQPPKPQLHWGPVRSFGNSGGFRTF